MRTAAMRSVTRKRRRQQPLSLLVVASGCQEISSAAELLSAPLPPDARIVTAKYQDTTQGFVLLMSLAVTGESAAMRRVVTLLRRTAEAHEMVVSMWPMSKEGGLP